MGSDGGPACKGSILLTAAWLIYVLFYFCRMNYSVAFPQTVVELGLDYYVMGVIAGLFSLLYSLGQVVSGFIVTEKGPWLLSFSGAVLSGLVNVAFGYTGSVVGFAILWLLNGFFQSTAWVSLVRVLVTELEGRRFGMFMGFFNTSWALGSSIAWIATGYIVSLMGWRYGFIVNGLTLMALGPILVLILKHCSKHGVEATYSDTPPSSNTVLKDLASNFKTVLLLAASYFLAKGVLYTTTVYLPSYIYSMLGSVISSSLVSSVYPASGALGMIIYGFMLDRYRDKEKVKPLLLATLLTTAILYVLPTVAEHGTIYAGILLVVIGLLVYGVNAHLITTIPSLLIERKIISLCIGIIDAAGSLGTFALNVATGYLINIYGFNQVFPCWSLWFSLLIPSLLLLYITSRSPRSPH